MDTSIPGSDPNLADSVPAYEPNVYLQVNGKTLYRQQVLPAPSLENLSAVTTESLIPPNKLGDNILLFIPTANKFKKGAIQATVEASLGKEQRNRLIVYQQNVDSGVGNQPYDEKGLEGAFTRIRNALAWLGRHPEVLKINKVGTVLVGAIENFIQRAGNGKPAVDYGIVVIYNATRSKTVGSISRGVTVPQEFLEEAEAKGFDDEARKSGKVTVGEVLARNFDIDAANWHEVVCGISRYALLTEALDGMKIPW